MVYRSKKPYGIIPRMKAELIFKDKYLYPDGAIREMTIWRLPGADEERPHFLKYSLFYGYPGRPLVVYDNERGKGDHRHYFGNSTTVEEKYTWISVEELMADFKADIARLRGENDD